MEIDVPGTSEFDAPVDIVVRGLPPRQRVTLTLAATDEQLAQWGSTATYLSDGAGTVDLATFPALRGSSYQGAWEMGLFSSMQCENCDSSLGSYQFTWPSTGDFTLSVAVRGRTLETSSFTRAFGTSYLCIQGFGTLQQGWLQSKFYYEPAPGQGCREWATQPVQGTGPVILAIGGSNESVPWLTAAAFAAHGYPALALTYYGPPNLVRQLRDIHLDYFMHALTWLKRQVGQRPIILYGFSRGSEAALLLASRHPSLFSGVIATSPSSVANQCDCPGRGRPQDALPTWIPERSEPPIPFYRGWNWSRYDPQHHPYNPPTPNEPGTIPVQNIRAPIFLACGTDDEIWTSCDYANIIMRELRGSRFPHKLDTVTAAGHFVGTAVPYQPGTPEYRGVQNAHGRERIWPDLLRFLARVGRS